MEKVNNILNGVLFILAIVAIWVVSIPLFNWSFSNMIDNPLIDIPKILCGLAVIAACTKLSFLLFMNSLKWFMGYTKELDLF